MIINNFICIVPKCSLSEALKKILFLLKPSDQVALFDDYERCEEHFDLSIIISGCHDKKINSLNIWNTIKAANGKFYAISAIDLFDLKKIIDLLKNSTPENLNILNMNTLIRIYHDVLKNNFLVNLAMDQFIIEFKLWLNSWLLSGFAKIEEPTLKLLKFKNYIEQNDIRMIPIKNLKKRFEAIYPTLHTLKLQTDAEDDLNGYSSSL